MGAEDMTPRAFYARGGSKGADVVTILHLPYTAWHLGYVAIGAALAPNLDWLRLGGTLVAFAAGLGLGAHALDEVHDRPLATGLSDRALWLLGWLGMAVAAAVAVAGAFVISPWVLAWAAVGVALACAYSLEWLALVHTDIGFALAWGAFPVLVGYWAQAEALAPAAVVAAVAATLLSLVQRSLSTAAKRLRRRQTDLSSSQVTALLATWEIPLRLLAATVVITAVALLATHI